MDKPWMNANITEAIAICQSAWTNGQTPKYNSFRNKVTKMCRHARRQFYNSMVDHTQAFNPRKWWKNVKLLAGLPKSKPLTKLSHNGQVLRCQELVNHICERFCTITNDILPLNVNQLPVSSIPDKYIISPEQVEVALFEIKVQKAVGPDEIPNWLLKTNSSSLCTPISSIFNALIALILCRYLKVQILKTQIQTSDLSL